LLKAFFEKHLNAKWLRQYNLPALPTGETWPTHRLA